jgi:hypothetical protein
MYSDQEIDISKAPFLLFSSHKNDYFGKMRKILKDNQNKKNDGLLEKAFFSEENIEIIKKQIVLEVYRESNNDYLLAKQNRKQIITLMKYVFYTYSQHFSFKIKQQIRELNIKVTELATKELMSHMNMYIAYLNRINGNDLLLERPINVSSAGNKTLPSITNTFF